MNGVHDGSKREDSARTDAEPTTVRCAVDPLGHDLDVSWTKGAIFEFESFEGAERWVADQNARVPGTLFLSEVPDGTGQLDLDYYVKYNAPGR